MSFSMPLLWACFFLLSIAFYACVKEKDAQQGGINRQQAEAKGTKMASLQSHITLEVERGEDCFDVVAYYSAERHWRDEACEVSIDSAERDGDAFTLTEAETAAALEIAKGQLDDDLQDQYDQEADYRYVLSCERDDM
jgi:hypothetical protein